MVFALTTVIQELTEMTQERIAGFMLGISVGTAIGFFLRQPNGTEENDNKQIPLTRTQIRTDDVREARDTQDRRWSISRSTAGRSPQGQDRSLSG
jgi:hypothetical protein